MDIVIPAGLAPLISFRTFWGGVVIFLILSIFSANSFMYLTSLIASCLSTIKLPPLVLLSFKSLTCCTIKRYAPNVIKKEIQTNKVTVRVKLQIWSLRRAFLYFSTNKFGKRFIVKGSDGSLKSLSCMEIGIKYSCN